MLLIFVADAAVLNDTRPVSEISDIDFGDALVDGEEEGEPREEEDGGEVEWCEVRLPRVWEEGAGGVVRGEAAPGMGGRGRRSGAR